MGGIVSSVRGKSMPVSDVAVDAGKPIVAEAVKKGWNPNSAVMMLTETQLDEFREAFNSFDEDGGGSIDASELEDVLKSLGQEATKEELDKLIAVADTDGSGDIDFLEFVVLVAHKMKTDNDTSKHSDDIKRAFRSKFMPLRGANLFHSAARALLPRIHRAVFLLPAVFDQNDSGSIDAAEMQRIMINLGEPMKLAEVDEVLRAFDLDGDGKIDLDEFATALADHKVGGVSALAPK